MQRAVDRRDFRDDRRPIDARQHLQHELRRRHERAGVAGADSSTRVTLFHRVDGKAHAGGLGAADRLGRLLIAADDVVAIAAEQAVVAAARLFTAVGPVCLTVPCPEGPMSSGAIGEVREEYAKL